MSYLSDVIDKTGGSYS